MEPITTAIISRAIYDIFLCGAKYTKSVIKDKLLKLIENNHTAEAIADKLVRLNVDENMSEKAIEKKIISDSELVELIKSIKNVNQTTINQQHFGVGDNIGNNKIIQG